MESGDAPATLEALGIECATEECSRDHCRMTDERQPANQEITPETADPAAIARVARHVEIHGIRLRAIDASIQIEPAGLDPDWVSDVITGVYTEIARVAQDRRDFATLVNFFAAYKRAWITGDKEPEFDPEDPPDVEVWARFELSYSGLDPEQYSDKDLEHFAAFNSVFNAWPYWRELAQTTSQRMGLSPLVIPVFRLPNLVPAQSRPTRKRPDAAEKRVEV